MAEVDVSSYPKAALPVSPLDTAAKLGGLEQQRLGINQAKLDQANQALGYMTRAMGSLGPNASIDQYIGAAANAVKMGLVPEQMLSTFVERAKAAPSSKAFYDQFMTSAADHQQQINYHIGQNAEQSSGAVNYQGVRLPASKGGGFVPATQMAVQPPVGSPYYEGGQAKTLGPAGPEGVRPALPAEAISNIESGGNYKLLGPVTRNGDRAYGKYQVMGNNIPEWTEKHLGKRLTPEQFLNDPAAQDAVFNGQFGGYSQKYGNTGAAKAWFAGEKGMNNPNAKDQLGTSVADYANKFENGMRRGLPVERPAAPVDRTQTGFNAAPPPNFEAGQKQYSADQASATSKATALKPLEEALDLGRQLSKTGVGTPLFNDIRARLTNLGIIPANEQNPAVIYQMLNKNLAQFVDKNGSRSDADLAVKESSNANAKTQLQPALIHMVQKIIGRERIEIARPGAFEGSDYSKYGKHSSEFPTSQDERAYSIDKMAPEDARQLYIEMKNNAINGTGAKKEEGIKFLKSLTNAKKLGLISGIN